MKFTVMATLVVLLAACEATKPSGSGKFGNFGAGLHAGRVAGR